MAGAANRVTKINAHGDIVNSIVIPHKAILIQPTHEDEVTRVLSIPYDETRIYVFDDKLGKIGETKVGADINVPTKSYLLDDKSIILFGHTKSLENSYTASVVWLSPDRSRSEEYIFKPQYSSTIVDAIPTGKMGEFVLARVVWPVHHVFGPNEKRLGTLITFLEVK